MNGKHGDNPLSDLAIHGLHPFPIEIEELLLQIDRLGRSSIRWPLGENWPFSPLEFEWAKGDNLDRARELLEQFRLMLEKGRGDEIMVDPLTGKPFTNDVED